MSVSLDDIWAEPIEQSPSRSARAQRPTSSLQPQEDNDSDGDIFTRPSKRSRSGLFLAGSDDEDAPSPKPKTTPGNPDIDHLFEDLDDIPPSTATRASNRDAARTAPSSPSRIPITSSSPPREGLSTPLGEGEKEAAPGRRPVPKLDEERLLAKDGFPALIKMCKDFKPKGKGHEVCHIFVLG